MVLLGPELPAAMVTGVSATVDITESQKTSAIGVIKRSGAAVTQIETIDVNR